MTQKKAKYTRFAWGACLALTITVTGCHGVGEKPDSGHGQPNESREVSTHAHDEPGLHLDVKPATAREWGVTISPVKLRRARRRLLLTGQVEENESTMYRVHARVPGIVETLTYEVGDLVRRGDVLCRLSSPELLQLRIRYVNSIQKHRQARADFERAQKLLASKAIAEREFTRRETAYTTALADLLSLKAELLATGVKKDRLHAVAEAVIRSSAGELGAFLTPAYYLAAPVDGRIAKRTAVKGDAVSQAEPLFEIVDQRRVWAEMDLMEKDLGLVHAGISISVESDAFPAMEFPGVITVLMPRMDRHLRSVKVRAEVENPALRLKPGMYVRGMINIAADKKSVAVPIGAVAAVLGVHGVFVAEEEGFHFHPVEVISEDDEGFVFVQGLKPGLHVASKGVYLLKAELEMRSRGEGDAHAGHGH